MATSKATIEELLKSHQPASGFRPTAFLGDSDDALYVYFKKDADYAKRLNERVTLYLSLETNQIVGCQIKGIRSIMEDLPYFIEERHGKEKLRLAFVAVLSSFDDEDDRHAFREAGRALDESGEVELIGCGS